MSFINNIGSMNQYAQTAALNDILEQLEMGNAPNILRNTGKNPPIGTVLGVNATYDQPLIDRPNQSITVGQTRIWVYADQNGVMNLRESHNGINWTTTSTINVSAGITNIMGWTKLTKRYAKIEYVNGGVAQTEFILLQYFLGVGVTLIKADDGDIVTLGAIADAMVTAGATGTASAKLRRLTADLDALLTKVTGIVDGSTPASTQLTGRNVVLTTTISAGQAQSGEIDLGEFQLFAILVPVSWDTANITFLSARDTVTNGGEYVSVYDDAGGEVIVTVTTNKMITLNNLALAVAPLRHIKLRSGTFATPVQQTADRTLYLIGKV